MCDKHPTPDYLICCDVFQQPNASYSVVVCVSAALEDWSSSFLIFKVDYSCHVVKTLQLYLNNKLYY